MQRASHAGHMWITGEVFEENGFVAQVSCPGRCLRVLDSAHGRE